MNLKRVPFFAYSLYLGKKWHLSAYMREAIAEEFCEDYRSKRLPWHKIHAIHGKGFCVDSWVLYGLDAEKCSTYLSDAEYYSMHPVNGEFTKWIDDKLTLKYLCAGTQLDQYLPEYYYQFDENGNILCLVDCKEKKPAASAEDVAQLLRDKEILAIKLMDGSFGRGFYKAEFKDNAYYLNGERLDLTAFCDRLKLLRNYLVIEYFRPHPEFARFCQETPSCIRYAVGRWDGEAKMLVGGLAIGTKKSGFVENYAVGGVWCYLDSNGYFESGDILNEEAFQNQVITHHPDTGAQLKGRIPHWDEIVQAGKEFCIHFPQLKYLGFDFVVTSDERVKILEINSLSALDCFQHGTSVFETPAGDFFRSLQKK